MKIEKINDNKIRITFNKIDLKENNIDIHSFMSNSIENQSIFLNMLDQAEREVGFISDNYKLCVDAIALNNGNFIITVTRIEKEILKSTRVQTHRKNNYTENNKLVYKFSNFDNFLNFENFLLQSTTDLIDTSLFSNSLYKCNNIYFLILENLDNCILPKISGILSEFATPVQNCELVIHKLKEYGTLLSESALHKKRA